MAENTAQGETAPMPKALLAAYQSALPGAGFDIATAAEEANAPSMPCCSALLPPRVRSYFPRAF